MTTKEVYLFDEVTGEFAGVYLAHQSPLEEGVFMEPIHSCSDAPPVIADGEKVMRVSGAWQIIPPVPPTPPTLEEVRAKQIGIIEAAYISEKEAPITYAGHVFQADAGSVELMTQVASALPAGTGIGWYDITNIEVPLTDVQFTELRGLILMRGQPLFKKRRTLKDAINAATTVTGVESVAW